jgi:Flp pilus assembly protein TadD
VRWRPYNLGQEDLAREHASRAYELRAHVTQAEKSSIEARYYEYVTGELDKDAEVRVLVAQNYPESAGSLNHLGNSDQALGHYDQAVQDYRRALFLDPTRGGTHSELATALLAPKPARRGPLPFCPTQASEAWRLRRCCL